MNRKRKNLDPRKERRKVIDRAQLFYDDEEKALYDGRWQQCVFNRRANIIKQHNGISQCWSVLITYSPDGSVKIGKYPKKVGKQKHICMAAQFIENKELMK